LFYNDDDIVYDNIKQLLDNNHDVIVFNHGSTDNTSNVINSLKSELLEIVDIDREKIGLYGVFEFVSRYVMDNYCKYYDWVSFPESDEFLEGPDRKKSYYEYILEAIDSEYAYIQFENYVFWYTEKDDNSIISPIQRVKHYCIKAYGTSRIFSWRSSSMNIRRFNHNPTIGKRYPTLFKSRHYQIRSDEHMNKRLFGSRFKMENGKSNIHNKSMIDNIDKMVIPSDMLYFDNGTDELVNDQKFNWKIIYQ
jgi:hypothetical protein